MTPIGNPSVPQISAAIADVISERCRQIEVEGWTAEHDDHCHVPGQLASAGAAYALNVSLPMRPALIGQVWPWSPDWWKPKNPRRDLVRAAALIIAEIDRTDRAQPNGSSQGAAPTYSSEDQLRDTIIKLLEILRQWEPDHASAEDRHTIVRAMYQIGILKDPTDIVRNMTEAASDGGVMAGTNRTTSGAIGQP